MKHSMLPELPGYGGELLGELMGALRWRETLRWSGIEGAHRWKEFLRGRG